jgi:hypothetical protein
MANPDHLRTRSPDFLGHGTFALVMAQCPLVQTSGVGTLLRGKATTREGWRSTTTWSAFDRRD